MSMWCTRVQRILELIVIIHIRKHVLLVVCLHSMLMRYACWDAYVCAGGKKKAVRYKTSTSHQRNGWDIIPSNSIKTATDRECW